MKNIKIHNLLYINELHKKRENIKRHKVEFL